MLNAAGAASRSQMTACSFLLAALVASCVADPEGGAPATPSRAEVEAAASADGAATDAGTDAARAFSLTPCTALLRGKPLLEAPVARGQVTAAKASRDGYAVVASQGGVLRAIEPPPLMLVDTPRGRAMQNLQLQLPDWLVPVTTMSEIHGGQLLVGQRTELGVAITLLDLASGRARWSRATPDSAAHSSPNGAVRVPAPAPEQWAIDELLQLVLYEDGSYAALVRSRVDAYLVGYAASGEERFRTIVGVRAGSYLSSPWALPLQDGGIAVAADFSNQQRAAIEALHGVPPSAQDSHGFAIMEFSHDGRLRTRHVVARTQSNGTLLQGGLVAPSGRLTWFFWEYRDATGHLAHVVPNDDAPRVVPTELQLAREVVGTMAALDGSVYLAGAMDIRRGIKTTRYGHPFVARFAADGTLAGRCAEHTSGNIWPAPLTLFPGDEPLIAVTPPSGGVQRVHRLRDLAL